MGAGLVVEKKRRKGDPANIAERAQVTIL